MKRLTTLTSLLLALLVAVAIGADRNASDRGEKKSKTKTAATQVDSKRSQQSGDQLIREPAKSRSAETPERSPAMDKLTEQPTPQPVQQIIEPNPQPVEQAASPTAGAAINMDWYSINHGGATEVAAGPFKMGVSVAQTAAGFVESGPFQMGLGFWYGASSASPGCACDCFNDPVCDGVISDIFDVSKAVDVAFRGGTDDAETNGLCPRTPSDVDCNGAVDIFDVTRIVEVAFRGGDPEVYFCDPCASSPMASR